jgi:peptide/nickel transport system permease protein
VTRTERLSTSLLVLLVAGAVLVPIMAPRDPLAIGDVLRLRLLPPGAIDGDGHLHLLGTDRFGRDLFARMMLAGRLSLAIGIGGALLAGLVGTCVGALAGWWRGTFDRFAMAVTDTLLAFPRLILLLLCASLWSPGAVTVVVVLAPRAR